MKNSTAPARSAEILFTVWGLDGDRQAPAQASQLQRFSPMRVLVDTTGALALLCVVGATSGCGHGRMLPSPSATLVPGTQEAAVAADAGVEVSANGADWRGRPENLEERLTPVRVRIVNHSGRPIELLYERFTLTGRTGRRYRALPPVPIDHQRPIDAVGTVRPIFATSGFYVAQRYRDIYPSLTPWRRPLSRDASYSETQYQRWPENLPTREMQRLSLPEGVLADGGEISGFLFFEDATQHEARLMFQAALDDGEQGGTVAAVEIPFRVQ